MRPDPSLAPDRVNQVVGSCPNRLLMLRDCCWASTTWHYATLPNIRCNRQALFGCGFAAMVVACLQLN